MLRIAHESRPAAPAPRAIATGEGWRLTEFRCEAGPQDRPYEERHGRFSIAAVAEGSFTYRGSDGTALLHPGALMLGNAGSCFQCGHEHATGDRCLALQVTPAYFEEAAASAAGSSRFRFRGAMLPAGPATLPLALMLERGTGKVALAAESLVATVVERVLALASGETAGTGLPPGDARRIVRVLRHIEAHAEDALDLDRLAGIAAMSKYHFLRSFRRAVGQPPYRYLLNLRMRRAALALAKGDESVASVALGVGFGDLSTFNRRFRALFGTTPLGWRRVSSLPPA
jgi:AraC-like DNA-binding protein